MSEHTYSDMLRTLSRDYYQGNIDFTDYRERRKSILEAIDVEYNGHHTLPDSDSENDESLLSKAIDFFKASDSDE